MFGWGDKADTAAKNAGVFVNNYDHVVYVFPPTASPCVIGLGEMRAEFTARIERATATEPGKAPSGPSKAPGKAPEPKK